jgi:hypothetical protein
MRREAGFSAYGFSAGQDARLNGRQDARHYSFAGMRFAGSFRNATLLRLMLNADWN